MMQGLTIFSICMWMTTIALGQTQVEEHVVTNIEYRQFIHYVRDSIARKILGKEVSTNYIMKTDHTRISWKKKIVWNYPEHWEALVYMFYPERDQFNRKKELDTRELYFEYKEKGILEVVHIYPDTLVWMRSADDPKNKSGSYAHCSTYNWHPYFDEYPVMGVSDEQKKAYLFWLNNTRTGSGIKAKPGVTYTIAGKAKSPKDKKLGITISIEPAALWDISEVEYKGFVNYVRDSLARRLLGEYMSADTYFNHSNKYGEELDPPTLKWDVPIPWKGLHEEEALEDMYVEQEDGTLPNKKFDVTKLKFEYYRMDLEHAAKPENEKKELYNRIQFIARDVVDVYPDTVVWTGFDHVTNDVIMDIGDPYGYETKKLSGYGIDYHQATAFYHWSNRHFSTKVNKEQMPFVIYLFPSRQEWDDLVQGKMSTTKKYVIEYPAELFRYTLQKNSK